MHKAAVHICLFQSAPDVTTRTRYADLKRDVLAAGRFSVFEATSTPRAARLFDRLCHDSEVAVFDMRFPWKGVRRR